MSAFLGTTPIVPEIVPATCYLCCQPLGLGVAEQLDHVPPRFVFPGAIRKTRNLQLDTLPVHATCHAGTGKDEQYFWHHLLLPLAHDTTSGVASRAEFLRAIKRRGGKVVAERARTEFDRSPGGLVLPGELVTKRYDALPVNTALWKMGRGLFFLSTGRCVPPMTARYIEVWNGDLEPVPELTIALMGERSWGHSPDLFDYKIRDTTEPTLPCFVLMRFWDRILAQVAFHQPRCTCPKCASKPA